jgi:hypothetical protein
LTDILGAVAFTPIINNDDAAGHETFRKRNVAGDGNVAGLGKLRDPVVGGLILRGTNEHFVIRDAGNWSVGGKEGGVTAFTTGFPGPTQNQFASWPGAGIGVH